MLLDSLLGAWLQVRYRAAEGTWRDQQGKAPTRQLGLAWMTNDRVNLLTIALITALALLS
jgi:uncharacterized membrane protein